MARNIAIMLHRVHDALWLENVLQYLRLYYRFESAEAISRFYNGETCKPFIHLTADDGDLSFYHNVFPLLKKYAIPATLFVSPKVLADNENYWFQKVNLMRGKELRIILGAMYKIPAKVIARCKPKEVLKLLPVADILRVIDEYEKQFQINCDRQNITVNQLNEMIATGYVVPGAHTLRHPILANESFDVSRMEILDSIVRLTELIGKDVTLFAYPNGTPGIDFGSREIESLKQSQIELSFSTRVDCLDSKDSKYDVPRLGLTYGNLRFVRSKIMLGKNWSRLKRIKGKISGTDRLTVRKKLQKYLILSDT